jgi:hypothetical protein
MILLVGDGIGHQGVHCTNIAFFTLGLNIRNEVSTMLEDHIITNIFIIIDILNKRGSWNVINKSRKVRFHAKKYEMKLLESPFTYAK